MTAATWKELALRCEDATGPDNDLDLAICIAANWCGPVTTHQTFQGPCVNLRVSEFGEDELDWEDTVDECWTGKLPKITADIQAIVSLIERELPGWDWQINGTEHKRKRLAWVHDTPTDGKVFKAFSVTSPLALCAAFCLAMAARAEQRETAE